MEMRYLKRYENDSEDAVPKAIYHRDDKGRDWYKHLHMFDKKYVVATDFEGNVLCVTTNGASGICPDNMHVFDCDSVPENIGLGAGWTYLNGVFEMNKEQLLKINKNKRAKLLREASDEVAALEDAETLGETTDEEAALLKSWRAYRLAISRVDVNIDNVEWPKKPN
ncbi:tail fiber assembly protein [Serratia phage MTx]|uniref:Tail fiber assembly protein n=1 Tax=Serratia phage MTx TaxID=2557553 RepID=A0A482MGR2_9CAUD|nr:tail fiber assembly protein [Serratia phage MTx]QBQ72362.1 tail fiber assembly protein [Serratia phage MTx]